EIHVQQVTVDDGDLIGESQAANAGGGGAAEFLGDLHSHGLGAEQARGGDDDAAVAAAEVVDGLAGLDLGGFQHFFDDDLGGGDVRRQALALAELLRGGRKGENQRGDKGCNPHEPI